MERRGRRARVAVPGGQVAGNPTGIERRGEGRKDGAGPPALTWSSQAHFDSKTILRVLHKETQKQSKINLGREFLFFQKCVLPVRNTWEYKVHLVFTLAPVVTVCDPTHGPGPYNLVTLANSLSAQRVRA